MPIAATRRDESPAREGACAPLRRTTLDGIFRRGQTFDRAPQPFPIHRLDDVLRESRGAARSDIVIRSEAAQGDAGQAQRLTQLPHEIETAPVGQTKITDHEIETLSKHQLARPRQSVGVGKRVAGVHQQPA